MRIAIAGGSGLIGRALVRSLLDDGCEVLVLSRDASRTSARVPKGAATVTWSADDVTSLSRHLEGLDGVVFLGGASVGPRPWTRRRRAIIADSRTRWVKAIVDAFRQLPEPLRPRMLVVASGVDAYPETALSPNPPPTTERTPIGLGFLADVTRSLEAEAAAAGPLGVRVVDVRMGHVLSRDAKLVDLLTLPVRFFIGGRIGNGRQWVSWIHIDDAVGLLRLALEDERAEGVLNVVAPSPARQSTVAQAIGAALHRPIWLPVPAPALRFVLGEEASLVLGSRRVVSEVAADLGYTFRHPSIDETFKDILR